MNVSGCPCKPCRRPGDGPSTSRGLNRARLTRVLLPPPRLGAPLEVMQGQVDFSFFMMRRTTRRWGVHATLYAADPWAVIEGAAVEAISPGAERRAARSFVHQAQEYFSAADRAGAAETRPVLYYYSFLNLAKVLAMTRGRGRLVGKAMHGVHVVSSAPHTPAGACVGFRRSSPSSISVLDETHHALEGVSLPSADAPIAHLLAQSVVGHRLWREAANRKERFLAVDHIRILHDSATQQLWATLHIAADTLTRRGRAIAETLNEAHLAPAFRTVSNSVIDGRTYRTFEQVAATTYGARPSDKVMDVVHAVKPLLWQTVTASPPYRRYYVYLSPRTESRYPQWMSVYLTLFWLGSLTRYQPVELFELFDGPFGPFFREFLATQPQQLLYQVASEIKRQDIAKAAVV